MDRRVTDGVVVYVSELLEARGVVHGFSTRLGGVSEGVFSSMNLGNPSGVAQQDSRENIEENYRRLMRAIGADGQSRCAVHQVHGNECVVVRTGVAHDTDMKADALVTQDASRVLSVRVADCVPVLLAGDDGMTVAAVHAGWRGVVSGVVASALRAMMELSTRNGRRLQLRSVVAAIGPSIGFEAFEVGAEVVAAFRQAMGDDAPVSQRPDGKGHVDLREAIRRQLRKLGVPDERIDVSDRCTWRDKDEFFSHRRERGLTGRMAALIGCR